MNLFNRSGRDDTVLGAGLHEGGAVQSGKRYFIRLNLSERIQHLIFLGCFIVLVITGFMLKLPEDVVKTFGEAKETVFFYRSLLHRIAGAVMILVSIYHIFYLLFRPAGRRWLMDMLPKLKDVKDFFGTMKYYLGFSTNPPEYDRFNYKQKMEYGALITGTTLMSVTGLLLWTEYRWSKFFLDIAIIVHGMEAILACLAIIIWHLYEVHLRPHKFPIDNVWITGVIDEDEMKEEFGMHYNKILEDPELQKIYIHGHDQTSKASRAISLGDIPRIY